MNYLIVDDEPPARELLLAYMQGLTGFTLVKACETALEAYEALHTHSVDLLLLDIKMPLLSGTDFLRSLRHPPLVILTTAYAQHALEGFELNVVDYLLKPIALPRLLQALDKAQGRWQPVADRAVEPAVGHIFVKADAKLHKVELADIHLIEGLQNYVKLHLENRLLVASYTMQALESMLSPHQFIRVHRSYIVPIAVIRAINGNMIETEHQSVPIGVNYRAAVQRLTGKK